MRFIREIGKMFLHKFESENIFSNFRNGERSYLEKGGKTNNTLSKVVFVIVGQCTIFNATNISQFMLGNDNLIPNHLPERHSVDKIT